MYHAALCNKSRSLQHVNIYKLKFYSYPSIPLGSEILSYYLTTSILVFTNITNTNGGHVQGWGWSAKFKMLGPRHLNCCYNLQK